jgi:molybdopterin converting factor small subunit
MSLPHLKPLSQAQDKTMQVNIRLSAGLAQLTGNARLQLTVPEDATVQDVVAILVGQYPEMRNRLSYAIPVIAGSHATLQSPVTSGQEVAFLMPVAGGKLDHPTTKVSVSRRR